MSYPLVKSCQHRDTQIKLTKMSFNSLYVNIIYARPIKISHKLVPYPIKIRLSKFCKSKSISNQAELHVYT